MRHCGSADEVALVFALQSGVLDALPLESVETFRTELPDWLDRTAGPLGAALQSGRELDEAGRATLKTCLAALAAQLARRSHTGKRADGGAACRYRRQDRKRPSA